MINFKKIAITFFTLTGFSLSGFTYAQEGTARLINVPNGEEMMKICVREGAANVINEFDQRGWDILGERLATGDPEWVEAVACLMHGQNFFIFEDLNLKTRELGDYATAILSDAWREVLLKKPETILELGRKIPLSLTCGYPYEAVLDKTHTVEWADDYLEQGLAALAKIDDESFRTVDNEYLQTEREVCEIYLKRDHKTVRKLIAARHQRG